MHMVKSTIRQALRNGHNLSSVSAHCSSKVQPLSAKPKKVKRRRMAHQSAKVWNSICSASASCRRECVTLSLYHGFAIDTAGTTAITVTIQDRRTCACLIYGSNNEIFLIFLCRTCGLQRLCCHRASPTGFKLSLLTCHTGFKPAFQRHPHT